MSQPQPTTEEQQRLEESVTRQLARLFEPCPKCIAARKALAEMQRLSRDVTLTADVLDPDDGEISTPGQWIGKVSIQCEECHNTEMVPSKYGQRLLNFIATFLASHGRRLQPGQDDVPF
jgi:hypothetical protein